MVIAKLILASSLLLRIFFVLGFFALWWVKENKMPSFWFRRWGRWLQAVFTFLHKLNSFKTIVTKAAGCVMGLQLMKCVCWSEQPRKQVLEEQNILKSRWFKSQRNRGRGQRKKQKSLGLWEHCLATDKTWVCYQHSSDDKSKSQHLTDCCA